MDIEGITKYLAQGNTLTVEDSGQFQITSVEKLIKIMPSGLIIPRYPCHYRTRHISSVASIGIRSSLSGKTVGKGRNFSSILQQTIQWFF